MDGNSTIGFGALLNNPLRNVMYEERKKFNESPHRQRELETLLAETQFTDTRQRAFQIVDRLRTQLKSRCEQLSLEEDILLKRVDTRQWDILERQDGKVLVGLL
ncbi:MAG: hypothetical protein AAFX39_11995 [Pseudomonadota bacterium]